MRIFNSLLAITLLFIFADSPSKRLPDKPEFSGNRALILAEEQLAFGPRFTGSEGHADVQSLIVLVLQQNGWHVTTQTFDYYGQTGANIIAYQQNGLVSEQEWIILGAHYDTRQFADNDPDPARQSDPVPGANDGASGVAVLLELSRVLPKLKNRNIWLVFFDGEDNGHINNQDWIQGSRYFAEQLDVMPNHVLIVDMVGDQDQNIFIENSSDQELVGEIWRTAAELGRSTFVPERKYTIIDDHTPFLQKGISAIDIIDFDYVYWHTTADTLDKISAESLNNVGDVLLNWIVSED